MTAIYWAAPVSGLFTDPNRWSADEVPNAADDAVCDASAATRYVVVCPTFESVDSIQTTAMATFVVKAGAFVTANGTGAGVNAGRIEIGDGTLWRTGGTITNSGAIYIDGQTRHTALDVDSFGATLDGGGSLVLSNFNGNVIEGQSAAATLTNVDDTISGSGAIGALQLSLINDAAGVIDANRSAGMTINMGAGALVNAGLIEVTGAGRMSIVGTTVDDTQGGTLSAGDGNFLILIDTTVKGGTIQSTGVGLVLPNGNDSVLDGRKQAVTLVGKGLPRTGAVVRVCDGNSVTIEGTINNTSVLELYTSPDNAKLNSIVIGPDGAILSGGGVLDMNTHNVSLEVVVGASATATLVNDNNRILGAGSLGDGEMRLVNKAAGVINSGGPLSLIIDTGAITIINAGQIVGSGAGGTIIESAVSNTGLLQSFHGPLIVDGPVSGSGSASVNGGLLEFLSAFSENVDFRRGKGTLELADSRAYAGTISGFSNTGTNTLDLTDIAFASGTTTARYAGTATGGVLTVKSGTEVAKIHFRGDFTAVIWSLSNDGDGGTDITDHAPAAPDAATSQAFTSQSATHTFIQAMAGIGSTAPSLSDPAAGGLRSPTPILASPTGALHVA